MFWIEGNASSGIHVDNKRTEKFYNQHLVKMMKEKELHRVVLFLSRFLRRVEACAHISEDLGAFDGLNTNKNGWLTSD